MTAQSSSALNDITVIEASENVAGPYCGRLLRAHGARVIKIEPESGDSSRNLLPRHKSSGKSGIYDWLNAGKEGLILDINEEKQPFATLCQSADILIHNGLQIDQSEFPHLIQCDISWYGREGPYSQFTGNDALISSLSGSVYGVGEAQGPPVIPSGYGPQILTGVIATIGIMSKLIAQSTSASGGQISLNVLESSMILTEIGAIAKSYDLPTARARYGVNRFPPTYPMGVFPCASGWIGVTALTPQQWQGFCQLLDLSELAEDESLNITLNRLQRADEINLHLLPKLLRRDARELVENGQALRVPLALVPTPTELLELPEFLERDALSVIETSDGKEFVGPGVPFKLPKTPVNDSGKAPEFKRFQEFRLSSLQTANERKRERSPSTSVAQVQQDGKDKPLSSLTIIDLSMGWSGPLATRFLADLGAEIIKVEACQYPDWWRGWEASKEWVANRDYEKMPTFNSVNRNKKGITLDLTQEKGRELLLKLIANADGLIENNTATVMPKLGLGYEKLREVNPDLVMLSMPAYGWQSSWSHFRAYGSTVEQAAGLPHLNGLPSWPPTHQHVALGDAVAGINAATAFLIALYHKTKTGEGQFIDFSQVESLLALGAHGIINASMNNEDWDRTGSRHPDFAPQGVYPCLGEDQWLTISVMTEEHWQLLASIAGLDANLDLNERQNQHSHLDKLIAQWSRSRTNQEAMVLLQKNGIPAACAYSADETSMDIHFQKSGTFEWFKGVHKDSVLYPMAPLRIDGARPELYSPAPKLGEHNKDVLTNKLSLTTEEIEELRKSQVIGNSPLI